MALHGGMKVTHELNLERPWLRFIPDNIHVLEMDERLLVIRVLHVDAKVAVVHQGDGPEFRDRLKDLAPLLKHGLQALLVLAVWRVGAAKIWAIRSYGCETQAKEMREQPREAMTT